MLKSISPSKYAWLGTSSGLRGVNFNCVVKKGSAQAEIYIDRGKDQCTENNLIYDSLFRNKEQIEKNFQDSVVWEPLPDSRACRIYKQVSQVGGWADEDRWEDIHKELIEIMIKMREVFNPFIKEIQKEKF